MAKPVGEKVVCDKPDVFQRGVFYHLVWYSDFGSESDVVVNVADHRSLKEIDKKLFKHGKTITVAGDE